MSHLAHRPPGLSPRALGFRMPAEWEPHAATWLAWPHNEGSWPGKLAAIPPVWVRMVEALATGEAVRIVCTDAGDAVACRRLLSATGIALDNVFVHVIPTNDSWIRDSGPIFVTRCTDGHSEAAIVNWGFNAWGGKYPPWDLDDRLPGRIAALLDMPVFEPGIILEGGSIDVNGCGTLLTTESCLLNPNRNPHLTRADVERYLCDYLGACQILWLGEGIVGDDTDGHVDDLTRFVDPTTVVTILTDDPDAPDFEALQANHRRLQEMTDQAGQPLRIVPLPVPDPVVHADQHLPASYANFYIGNAAVLVPTFGQPTDATALHTLRALFPTRRVVGIGAADLVWGLGAFHCVTQQQPTGTPAPLPPPPAA